MPRIRLPAVAGQFYPEDPAALRSIIEGYLAEGSDLSARPQKIVGCIVPHAGYMYSGSTAAHVYRALVGSTHRTVVLIGPSHRDSFGGVSVFDGSGYRTPLGDMLVETAFARSLVDLSEEIMLSDLGHRMEHALEVQIPFLQTVLPQAKIVPITMGSQSRHACESLSSCLTGAIGGQDVLIVASSDLSHFHPYEEASAMDGLSANFIETYDADGFMDALATEHVEACGGGPIAVAMKTAKALGATDVRILHTCNSGDVSEDRSSVVGYLSALFGRAKE